MNAAVRLRHPTQSRQYQRLRRVKRGEISIAASVLADPGSKNDAAAREAIASLVEMLPGFRAHRSIPSSRISLISDVRQR